MPVLRENKAPHLGSVSRGKSRLTSRWTRTPGLLIMIGTGEPRRQATLFTDGYGDGPALGSLAVIVCQHGEAEPGGGGVFHLPGSGEQQRPREPDRAADAAERGVPQ